MMRIINMEMTDTKVAIAAIVIIVSALTAAAELAKLATTVKAALNVEA